MLAHRMGSIVPLKRFLVLASVLLAVAGCDKGEPMPVRDYAQRLSRALDQSLPQAPPVQRLTYPRTRDLLINFESIRINLLDYLSLGDCALQGVVATGNSALGRLALPSQRLLYELDFLGTGEACLVSVAGDEETSALLAQALALKRSQIDARIWSATLGSEEFRHFWIGTAVPPDAETLHALMWLSRSSADWIAGNRQADAGTLELQLKAVDERDAGALLARWQYLVHHLPTATDVLRARLDDRPLCFPGMKTQDAEIFRNVVMTHFIQGLQVHIAGLSRETFDLMQIIRPWEKSLAHIETSAYRNWRMMRDEVIAAGRQAVQDHVAALEPLMMQCGYLPGNNNSTGENNDHKAHENQQSNEPGGGSR